MLYKSMLYKDSSYVYTHDDMHGQLQLIHACTYDVTIKLHIHTDNFTTTA